MFKQMKTISRILIFAMFHLCWLTSYGWAEIAGTDSVIAVSMQISADREKIRALLNREDVQHQLETYGISHEEALARVNSLTDEEVSKVKEEIESIPAGEGGGTVAGGILLIFAFYFIIQSLVNLAMGKFSSSGNSSGTEEYCDPAMDSCNTDTFENDDCDPGMESCV